MINRGLRFAVPQCGLPAILLKCGKNNNKVPFAALREETGDRVALCQSVGRSRTYSSIEIPPTRPDIRPEDDLEEACRVQR